CSTLRAAFVAICSEAGTCEIVFRACCVSRENSIFKATATFIYWMQVRKAGLFVCRSTCGSPAKPSTDNNSHVLNVGTLGCIVCKGVQYLWMQGGRGSLAQEQKVVTAVSFFRSHTQVIRAFLYVLKCVSCLNQQEIDNLWCNVQLSCFFFIHEVLRLRIVLLRRG
ncbi:unnamed protein product, partial [Ectocarpus sp. 4 AP-2014]